MAKTQNDNHEGDLAELGYPVHVFIDTSTLERMQFPFGQSRLRPLIDRLAAGDMRLAIPEIITHEIRAHVSAHVEKAKSAHARFRRDASILRIIDDPDVAALLVEVDWPAVRKAALAATDRFFGSPGVTVLRIDGEDAVAVFDDYFARRAPFGEGKKKSEFPDSFAMKALLRYAQSSNCKIAVLTEDSDWQAACADHAELVRCLSLEQLADYSQVAEAKLHHEIRQLLAAHRPELEAAVAESFHDRGFFWDSDEGCDGDIEEIYNVEIESWSWSVIATDGHWADIGGDACIEFYATVKYPDPTKCYRDPDTRELVFLDYVTSTLASTTTVEARVRINVEALRRNELEFEELIVNDDRDIWFSGDEIEIISDHDENYDEQR